MIYSIVLIVSYNSPFNNDVGSRPEAGAQAAEWSSSKLIFYD